MADEFYKDHRLTREGMERTIREGGSVLYRAPNGERRLIMSVDQIPSAAELAKGDAGKEAAARDDLQRQIADLRAQMASLSPAETPKPSKKADGAADETAGAESK